MSAFSLFSRDVPASQLDSMTRSMGCVAYDPAVQPSFGYVPSLAAGIIFTIVFAGSMIGHIFQSTIPRKWWYLLIAVGSLGELIGWAGRLASHWCVYNKSLYIMQIAILIICESPLSLLPLRRLTKVSAPCFYSAALYYLLAEFIRRWGRRFSPFSPNLYLWIFISFDLLSIVLQGVGGGLAAAALGSDNGASPDNGTHIMLAGIIVQLAAMCVFSVMLFMVSFRARALWTRPTARRTQMLLATVLIGDVLILTRNFYRAIELGEGWTSYLMETEVYQCVLDAALMALFSLSFNVIHPIWFLGKDVGSAYRQDVDMGNVAPPKTLSDSSDEENALKAPA